MADDPVIRATTTVDVSGLRGGMAQASTVTQAGLSDIKAQYREAAAAVKEATANMAQAAAAFGPAAAAGNAQATAALQQYEAELATATVRVAELKAGMQEASAANAVYASSMTEARFAAQLLGRELGVPIPRALSSIASQSSLLGPILEAAFPIVAIGGFAMVLSEIVQKYDPLIKAEKELAEVTKQTDHEFEALTRRLEHLQVQQLVDEFGKLKGAQLAAFQVGTSAAEAAAQVSVYETQLARAQQKTAEFSVVATVLSKIPWADPFTLVGRFAAASADKVEELQRKIDVLKLTVKTDTQGSAKDLADAAKDAAADAKRAAREQAQAVRQQQQELKAAYDEMLSDLKSDHAVTRTEELSFRENELAEIQQYGGKYKALQRQVGREIGTLQQEVFRQQAEAAKKDGELRLRLDDENFKAELSARVEHDRLVVEGVKKAAEAEKKAYEEARHILSANTENGQTGAQASGDAKKGQLDRARAVSGDKSVEAEVRYLEAVKAIDAQIFQDKYQLQMKLLALDSLNDPKKLADDQNKLAKIYEQGNQKILQDQTRILVAQTAAYRVFWNGVSAGFGKVTNDILTWNHRWFQDLGQMLTQMVEKFAQYEVQRVVTHVAANASIQSAETALMGFLRAIHLVAAVATVTTDKTEATQQVLTSAGVAAANAYAATAIIPFVGPELAPAAAATAYAGALTAGSLAALETGTNYVPSTGQYTLHQGEAVVPKQYNPAAGGAGGGGFTHNGDIHINAGQGANGRQIAKDFKSTLDNLIRNKSGKMA